MNESSKKPIKWPVPNTVTQTQIQKQLKLTHFQIQNNETYLHWSVLYIDSATRVFGPVIANGQYYDYSSTTVQDGLLNSYLKIGSTVLHVSEIHIICDGYNVGFTDVLLFVLISLWLYTNASGITSLKWPQQGNVKHFIVIEDTQCLIAI